LEAYKLRGALLLHIKRPVEATRAFRHAHNICKDISVYQGLVESYLDQDKANEAMNIANECCRLMNGNPKALALQGKVLWKRGRITDAKRIFSNALRIDARCSEASFCIIDIMLEEGTYEKALSELKALMVMGNSGEMYTRMGEVYSLQKDYVQAIEAFISALT
jgi:tetratricopeptide (TPR) repeat protein